MTFQYQGWNFWRRAHEINDENLGREVITREMGSQGSILGPDMHMIQPLALTSSHCPSAFWTTAQTCMYVRV
jgi:hypothetical protein